MLELRIVANDTQVAIEVNRKNVTNKELALMVAQIEIAKLDFLSRFKNDFEMEEKK